MNNKVDSSNLVNVSIVWYISFTVVFFVLKFIFAPENKFGWIMLFLLISCVFQLVQNINITASPDVCGVADIKSAIYSTCIPWILVFAVFTLLMVSSPGWLRVFSNTFGVFAAQAYNIQALIQAVIRKPISLGTNYEYLKMIENIYSDSMSLVLELNLEDVTDVSGVFTFPALNKLEELNLIAKLADFEHDPTAQEEMRKDRKALYKALLLKDNVGYFFWFILIGIFCILVSTNSILSAGCSPKVAKSYDSIFK